MHCSQGWRGPGARVWFDELDEVAADVGAISGVVVGAIDEMGTVVDGIGGVVVVAGMGGVVAAIGGGTGIGVSSGICGTVKGDAVASSGDGMSGVAATVGGGTGIGVSSGICGTGLGDAVTSSGDWGDGTMTIVSPTFSPLLRSKLKNALFGSSTTKYPLSLNSRSGVPVGGVKALRKAVVGRAVVGGSVIGSVGAGVGCAVIGTTVVGVIVGVSVGGGGIVFSLQTHCLSAKVLVVSQINHS
jgi:hypothetical protein